MKVAVVKSKNGRLYLIFHQSVLVLDVGATDSEPGEDEEAVIVDDDDDDAGSPLSRGGLLVILKK